MGGRQGVFSAMIAMNMTVFRWGQMLCGRERCSSAAIGTYLVAVHRFINTMQRTMAVNLVPFITVPHAA